MIIKKDEYDKAYLVDEDKSLKFQLYGFDDAEVYYTLCKKEEEFWESPIDRGYISDPNDPMFTKLMLETAYNYLLKKNGIQNF